MNDVEALNYYESRDLVNRRGRRLLREVGRIVGGPDIYANLPGDDAELSADDVAEIRAEAAEIVDGESRRTAAMQRDWKTGHPKGAVQPR